MDTKYLDYLRMKNIDNPDYAMFFAGAPHCISVDNQDGWTGEVFYIRKPNTSKTIGFVKNKDNEDDENKMPIGCIWYFYNGMTNMAYDIHIIMEKEYIRKTCPYAYKAFLELIEYLLCKRKFRKVVYDFVGKNKGVDQEHLAKSIGATFVGHYDKHILDRSMNYQEVQIWELFYEKFIKSKAYKSKLMKKLLK